MVLSGIVAGWRSACSSSARATCADRLPRSCCSPSAPRATTSRSRAPAPAASPAVASTSRPPSSCRNWGSTRPRHVARRITPGLVRASDLVLTAETDHRSVVVRETPEAFRRTFTVREFARLGAGLELFSSTAHRRSAARARRRRCRAARLGRATRAGSGRHRRPVRWRPGRRACSRAPGGRRRRRRRPGARPARGRAQSDSCADRRVVTRTAGVSAGRRCARRARRRTSGRPRTWTAR